MNLHNMPAPELLARVLAAEAGGEGPMGQQAVANVVRNRVNSPVYPNDPVRVMLQDGQFSALNGVTGYAGGQGANNLWQKPVDPALLQIANAALAPDYQDNITGGALNYYNPQHANPSWAQGAQWNPIGNHVFGTAGGNPGAGNPVMSQMNFLPEASQNAGNGFLPEPKDNRTIRQRATDLLRGRSDNPTVNARRMANNAEIAQRRALDSMEVFNTNAPASWLNVLGTTAETLGANALGDKAATEAAAGRSQASDLAATGRRDPQTLAQITALDPELGARLSEQQHQAEMQRSQQIHAGRMQDDQQDHTSNMQTSNQNFQFGMNQVQNEQSRQNRMLDAGLNDHLAERQWGRGLASDQFNAGREVAANEKEWEMKKQYQEKEHEQRTREIYTKASLTPPKDKLSPMGQQLVDAGYTPGTPEFENQMQYLLDPENHPDVLAAKIPGGISQVEKVLSTNAANGFTAIMNAGAQGRKQLQRIHEAELAVEKFQPGALAGFQKTAGQLLSSLGLSDDVVEAFSPTLAAALEGAGLSTEQAAAMEQVDQVTNEAVIGLIGVDSSEGGFPANNFSNADLKFLQKTIFQITDTKEGFLRKLAVMKWTNERAVDKANKQNEWIAKFVDENNRSPNYQEFYAWNNNYNEESYNSHELREYVYNQMRDHDANLKEPVVHLTYDRATAQEEVKRLPSGTSFRDPFTGEIMVKE